MSEDCRDCVPATLVTQLIERVDRLESKIDERFEIQGGRIGNVERKTDVNEEQTKMIFKILGEIKESIDKIGNKLEVLEKEPGEKWKEIVKTALAFLTTAALGYFIAGK